MLLIGTKSMLGRMEWLLLLKWSSKAFCHLLALSRIALTRHPGCPHAHHFFTSTSHSLIKVSWVNNASLHLSHCLPVCPSRCVDTSFSFSVFFVREFVVFVNLHASFPCSWIIIRVWGMWFVFVISVTRIPIFWKSRIISSHLNLHLNTCRFSPT